MKIAGIVVGSLLLMVGLSSLPRLVGHIGNEDVFVLLGRFSCLGCEILGGSAIIFYGIRGLIQSGNGRPDDLDAPRRPR
jgi:hypothetical protein